MFVLFIFICIFSVLTGLSIMIGYDDGNWLTRFTLPIALIIFGILLVALPIVFQGNGITIKKEYIHSDNYEGKRFSKIVTIEYDVREYPWYSPKGVSLSNENYVITFDKENFYRVDN